MELGRYDHIPLLEPAVLVLVALAVTVVVTVVVVAALRYAERRR